jgi:hypothetical protein
MTIECELGNLNEKGLHYFSIFHWGWNLPTCVRDKIDISLRWWRHIDNFSGTLSGKLSSMLKLANMLMKRSSERTIHRETKHWLSCVHDDWKALSCKKRGSFRPEATHTNKWHTRSIFILCRIYSIRRMQPRNATVKIRFPVHVPWRWRWKKVVKINFAGSFMLFCIQNFTFLNNTVH